MKRLAPARRKLQSNFRAHWMVLTLVVSTCMAGCHRDRSATPIPDFTLPQVRGGVFHLRAAPSQAVLLAFLQTVPDTADTPSRQQVGFLLSMNHQYNARGLKVAIVDSSALVTRQSPKREAMINASYDWHLDIPLLEDDDNRLARRLGITELPTLMLLASDGSIRQQWHGLTGPAILAQAIEKVCCTPSGRAEELAP